MVEFDGEACVVEAAVAKILRDAGCDGGAWAYSYPYFTESLPAEQYRVDVTPELDALQRQIAAVLGKVGLQGGRWDVWGWRGDQVLFVEVKKEGEPFNLNQIMWLYTALQLGISPEAFVVLEYQTWAEELAAFADIL